MDLLNLTGYPLTAMMALQGAELGVEKKEEKTDSASRSHVIDSILNTNTLLHLHISVYICIVLCTGIYYMVGLLFDRNKPLVHPLRNIYLRLARTKFHHLV